MKRTGKADMKLWPWEVCEKAGGAGGSEGWCGREGDEVEDLRGF